MLYRTDVTCLIVTSVAASSNCNRRKKKFLPASSSGIFENELISPGTVFFVCNGHTHVILPFYHYCGLGGLSGYARSICIHFFKFELSSTNFALTLYDLPLRYEFLPFRQKFCKKPVRKCNDMESVFVRKCNITFALLCANVFGAKK